MSDGVVHDPRASSLALLDGLVRRGRALIGGPDERIWQLDCAAAINELSGGNKAHWLSRAYSSALLVRSTDGEAVVEADPGEIVRRVLDVLEQGRRSLISMDTAEPYSADAQEPHRFDFVHDPALRPVLERAFVESRSALEKGNYEAALKTTCGILEAIITDALVRLKPDTTTVGDDVRGVRLQPDLTNWSFDERIAAAEQAGLIRGGCARLPSIARAYRDAPLDAVSERDATRARQVLHVIVRDLDPGR